MAVAEVLTWIIPPMPLYDEFYKTANHEGAIFLHASLSCRDDFVRHSFGGGSVLRLLSGAEGLAHEPN